MSSAKEAVATVSALPAEPSPTPLTDTICTPSPCLSRAPSSDNLRGFMRAKSWDGQSMMAMSELTGLQSAGGSSTQLLSHRAGETPLTSGTSSPVLNGRHRGSLGPIHEGNPEPPYHVLPYKQKKTLMYIAAVAGMFSSLSANIYFPALGQISKVRRRPLVVDAANMCVGYQRQHITPKSYDYRVYGCPGPSAFILGTTVGYKREADYIHW